MCKGKFLLDMIKRKKNNLVEAMCLLKRKRGAGRKRLIDEKDENFLEKFIVEKAAAHGRCHDVVWYLNHRVKGSHLLQLLNQHHLKRTLPFIKSFSAFYNRSTPKNKRSKQAQNYIWLALFCCKKSPKSKDNSNAPTHNCQTTKKVTSSALCNDDRFSQKIIASTDENCARMFKNYEFSTSMLSCTASVFLYMSKSLRKDQNGNDVLVVGEQDVVVAVKSKYFVDSSRSVWVMLSKTDIAMPFYMRFPMSSLSLLPLILCVMLCAW